MTEEGICQQNQDRYGEYGIVGAEQADESHFDGRVREEDDAEGDFGADGRIHFAKEKLYGREEELDRCRELFETNVPSAIFISGYSGSGKSRVVEEFVKLNSSIVDRKPTIVFLRSKSEAMRESVPFSSITGLFDNIDKSVSKEIADMRDQVQETLGADAKLLLKVFPKLDRYLGKDTGRTSIKSVSSDSKSDSLSISSVEVSASGKKKDTKKRMMLALQFFFRALSSRFKRRLCLFLDDLQWVDSLSMELIESLLIDDTINNMFFFGGFRSNEVEKDHILLKKTQEIKEKREVKEMKGYICIELEALHKEAIGEFIADSLGLSFEETLPLTNAVFTKTLGNPFFTRQALEYLVLKNALYYDTISFRWDWKLQEKELKDLISDDVLEMIKVKIEHLEPKLQEVLMTASCTRSTFDVETILVLLFPRFLNQKETLLGTKEFEEKYEEEKKQLVGLLNQAVVEGLLVKPDEVKRASNLRFSVLVSAGDEYAFAHDKIQETARSLISSTGNEMEFLQRVGNILSERAEDPVYGEDWMFFAACEHLNRVMTYCRTLPESENQEQKKPDFMDKVKQFELAALNLQTAQLSMDLLAFPATLDFCEQGIACLPADEDERWMEKYRETTLHLYSISAQAHHGVSNIDQAEKYCNLVINQRSGLNANVSTIEAIPALLVYLDLIGDKGEKEAALELCLEILQEFGISIPRNEKMLRAKVWLNLKQIKSRYLPTEDSIRDMPQVSDPVIVDKMELMKKASGLAYAAHRTYLYMLLNCEAVKLVSEHGLTESSAQSIASFSNVLMHIYNDFKTSPKLAELAIRIADRQQSKYNETQPLNTANLLVLGWVRPISSCLKYHERTYNSGIASGNLNGAAVSKWHGFQNKLFSCCMTLPELEEDCRKSIPEMRRMGQNFIANIACIVWQMTLNLIGKSGNPNTTVLTGEVIDESSDLYKKKMPLRIALPAWSRLAVVVFGDFETAAEDALKRGDEFPNFAVGMMYGFESVLRAIPLLIVARSDSPHKGKYRTAAVKLLKRVRGWVKKGCINLVGPLQLMEAEYMALQKNEKGARSNFEMAIAICRKENFHHFAGLSCELYSSYLSEVGDSQGEKIYLQGAIDDYRRWGAARKVDFLKSQLPE